MAHARERITAAIIVCIVVLVFLAGNLLGGFIMSDRLSDNTRAVTALEMVTAELQLVQEQDRASSVERRENQDLLQCLLFQFTLPQEGRPTQLTPEICPEVDFGQLHNSTIGG